MKITKVALLKLIETETNRLILASEEKYAVECNRYDEDREEYIRSTREAWKTLASYLEVTPVPLWEAVPETLRYGNYRDGLRFWRGSFPKLVPPDLTELKRMRALIEIVADDLISTSELARLGFKIQFLFRG